MALFLIPQVGWENFEKPLDFWISISYNKITVREELNE